jgi:signal transduction histidine kinase
MNSDSSFEEENGMKGEFKEDYPAELVHDIRGYINQLPDPTLVFSHTGHILGINSQAENLLGVSAEEVYLRVLDRIFQSAANETTLSFTGRFVEQTSLPVTNAVASVFLRYRSQSPMISVRTVRFPDSGVGGLYLSMLTDVSSSGFEIVLDAKSNPRVASAKGNIDMPHRRIIEMLSHEFRTPLTIIRSSADVMRRYADRLNDEQRDDYLRIIQEQVQQLAALVHSALSSTEPGQSLQAELSAVVPADFLQSILVQCKELPEEHSKVRVENEWPKDTIMVDEHLLRLALCNILGNAVKFSNPDQEVTLRLYEDNNDLVFSVIDHGKGIPGEDLVHIYEPFYRAANAKDVQGIGLGLTLARDFIQAHNGSFSVVSSEGQGTTVTIRIPQP